MAVFKIEKNKNYTTMSNYHLQDKLLSYRAKGLLSFMLSLPDDWDYSMNGLASISKENIKAIRTILHELEEHLYLTRNRIQNQKGQFEYDYCIYEIPYNINPYTLLPYTDIPYTQKEIQINTNIINTERQIDKDDKTKTPFFVAEEHNHLTLELIKYNFIDENDTQIFYYDNLFEDLLQNDNSYKELLIIIHYIIPRVKDKKFKDEEGNDINNKFGYFKSAINSNIQKLKHQFDDLWKDNNI